MPEPWSMTSLNAKKILIASARTDVLLSMSHALRAEGAEVVTATGLDSAEAAVSGSRFDVVITDVGLLGLIGNEGLELLSYIKRNWPETAVIVNPERPTPALKRLADDLGADFCFECRATDLRMVELIRILTGPSR